MARLSFSSLAPEANAQLLALSKYLQKSSVGGSLLDLIYLRVSQINGCSYCVDLHWQDARRKGEDLQKLNAVVVWRGTHFFTEQERAALAWAEAVTNLHDKQVPEETFTYARQHFTEKELVDLTFAVGVINVWNRLAIAFHVTPSKRES
jgi:AhpD family alkylhydroperoxidase